MTSIHQFINRQIQRWNLETYHGRPEGEEAAPTRRRPKPWITLSRQTGSGGEEVASRLAEITGFQVFDREILESMAEVSDFRRGTLDALDERVQSNIGLYVEGLFRGKSHDAADYLRHLVEVIMGIAHHGNAILLGRGAAFVLKQEAGLHVRVVAPLEDRIHRMASLKSVSEAEAARLIRDRDRERADFVHRFFGGDVADPAAYDLCLNTSTLGILPVVHLIQVALLEKMEKAGSASPAI